MIDIAKQKSIKYSNKNISFVEGDAEDPLFVDGSVLLPAVEEVFEVHVII